MKIAHEFTVGVPVEQAWQALTDLEGVAECVPGATMTGREGEDYLGRIKVKIGPVTSEFSGRARFVERDERERRAVIDAGGRETRGGGNASAAVTARLREVDGGTAVSVDTELTIVGKLAQFGSGVVQQVSANLMGEFADRLEQRLGESAPLAARTDPSPSPPDTPPDEVLDLGRYAGRAVAVRLVPIVLALVVVAVVVVLLV